MTSCTIIISHYESLPFLQTCIRQIRKYRHIKIRQHIIIADQSSEETHLQIREWYSCSADITIIKTLPLWSGYGVDVIVRDVGIQTAYVCQLHSDAFPIHKEWLALPIKLIKENNFSFVGQLQFISKPTDTIYPPEPFFAMAQSFHVSTVTVYEEMAYNGGFTRFHERPYVERGMGWMYNDWAMWAKKDYSHRGSDDDVVAFHWEDKYREHDKLGLAISGYIEPSYGRLIDDLVFHFGSCREAIGVMGSMPELYKYYTQKINENYSDELIEEMVALAKKNSPPELEILSRNFWDGKLKKSFPTSGGFNKIMGALKK